jgi:3-dehydroquinate dehydratase
MKPTFLRYSQPLLTVMLQCETPETAVGRIRNALCLGGDAFGLQVESLRKEYQDPEVYRRLMGEMRGKPCYVTNYRSGSNRGLTDEKLAEGLMELARCGATLCDVMGDFYCQDPVGMTWDGEAVQKQRTLIDALHGLGAEVLMSAHMLKFTPAERVLEVAREQIRRGADIAKIVTYAENMAQQIENLRVTDLLRRELGAPFLFLSGGEATLHRRLGIRLGCCMCLCVVEHDALSTPAQPLLQTMKTIRDGLDF